MREPEQSVLDLHQETVLLVVPRHVQPLSLASVFKQRRRGPGPGTHSDIMRSHGDVRFFGEFP